ncbi:hypothetical protein EYF80_066413 [Liparis tanakae]|uniref:Uncharacterized protein n=1 Tax=Liparis tanakae TaxID=230148 RepID=A0A4Z2E3W1_9TELE|nr:hypothetical protein EYF80_066413 [Liparis tanakae]
MRSSGYEVIRSSGQQVISSSSEGGLVRSRRSKLREHKTNKATQRGAVTRRHDRGRHRPFNCNSCDFKTHSSDWRRRGVSSSSVRRREAERRPGGGRRQEAGGRRQEAGERAVASGAAEGVFRYEP